jgi:hypothetical protein
VPRRSSFPDFAAMSSIAERLPARFHASESSTRRARRIFAALIFRSTESSNSHVGSASQSGTASGSNERARWLAAASSSRTSAIPITS